MTNETDVIYQAVLDALASFNRVEASQETRKEFKEGVSRIHDARRGLEEIRAKAKKAGWEKK